MSRPQCCTTRAEGCNKAAGPSMLRTLSTHTGIGKTLTSTVDGRAFSRCVEGSRAARNSFESHLKSSSTL